MSIVIRHTDINPFEKDTSPEYGCGLLNVRYLFSLFRKFFYFAKIIPVKLFESSYTTGREYRRE